MEALPFLLSVSFIPQEGVVLVWLPGKLTPRLHLWSRVFKECPRTNTHGREGTHAGVGQGRTPTSLSATTGVPELDLLFSVILSGVQETRANVGSDFGPDRSVQLRQLLS